MLILINYSILQKSVEKMGKKETEDLQLIQFVKCGLKYVHLYILDWNV